MWKNHSENLLRRDQIANLAVTDAASRTIILGVISEKIGTACTSVARLEQQQSWQSLSLRRRLGCAMGASSKLTHLALTVVKIPIWLSFLVGVAHCVPSQPFFLSN